MNRHVTSGITPHNTHARTRTHTHTHTHTHIPRDNLRWLSAYLSYASFCPSTFAPHKCPHLHYVICEGHKVKVSYQNICVSSEHPHFTSSFLKFKSNSLVKTLFFLLNAAFSMALLDLTLILLTWKIWWAPNNASKWQMGFNSAFKGLMSRVHLASFVITLHKYRGSDKSLARPGRKQANVSLRMTWISFGALSWRGKKKLDDSSRLDVVEIARVPWHAS